MTLRSRKEIVLMSPIESVYFMLSAVGMFGFLLRSSAVLGVMSSIVGVA